LLNPLPSGKGFLLLYKFIIMSNPPLSTSEYHSYYQPYIDKASVDGLAEGLQNGLRETSSFFNGIPVEKHSFRYEEGKWTPKEILLHIIDTERVFTYRALQFARSEGAVLKGFDQDEFAKNGDTTGRTMQDLLAEFEAVRMSTIHFAKSCSPASLVRMGEASGHPLSVRAALYITIGHEMHHCDIVQERYL